MPQLDLALGMDSGAGHGGLQQVYSHLALALATSASDKHVSVFTCHIWTRPKPRMLQPFCMAAMPVLTYVSTACPAGRCVSAVTTTW